MTHPPTPTAFYGAPFATPTPHGSTTRPGFPFVRSFFHSSQIFSSFSPFTTGFAFAICSLPIPLKSNSHACCSG